MADSNILSDFGIKILEQEIDDVIFQMPRSQAHKVRFGGYCRCVWLWLRCSR